MQAMSSPVAMRELLEELVVHFVPPEVGRHPATPSDVEAADWTARHWTSVEPDALDPGSAAHKRAICAMFQETFNPYRPSVIAWPTLSPDELRRLQSLPIWDIAVQTEGRARLSFAAYANSLDDAEIRSAIMLNAWEENRHKEVLSHMVRAYGIELAEEPPYLPPRNREFAFLVTGYSEIDRQLLSPSGFSSWPSDRVSFRQGSSRRSNRSSRRNAATSCSSPTGWRGAVPTSGGGLASGSSCVSLRPGSTSRVCASGLRAAWAPTRKSRIRTATSP